MCETIIGTFNPQRRVEAGHPNFGLDGQEVAIDLSSMELNGGSLLLATFQVQPIESQTGDTTPRTVEGQDLLLGAKEQEKAEQIFRVKYQDLTLGVAAKKKIGQAFEKTRTGNGKTPDKSHGGKPVRGAHNGASHR
ncbi:MAG: hypothetical protein WC905_03145 [Patescibacteria group bacterium]|jgi:hypothetical protein